MQQDPELTAILLRVGECLAVWSQVEHSLANLFVTVMEGDMSRATTVFAAIISFEARLQMVNALIERDSDTAFSTSWNALFNKLSLLHKRRHQVAHFTIIYNGTVERHFLHPFFSFGKAEQAKPLSSKDLELRIQSFERAQRRVNNLYFYALHRLGRLPAGLLPEGGPAQLLRNPNAQNREGTPPPSQPSGG